MKSFILSFFIVVTFSVSAQVRSLDYYIGQAIQSSPLFTENKNQIESLKYDSMQIRALYKPQINFDNYNLYAPIINGYGYDKAITNGGAITTVIGANISFAGKKNLENQLQKLHLQSQSLQVSKKLTEKELKRSITSQYILVYGEQQILQKEEEVLKVLKKEEVILKRLAEEGTYRQTDYLYFLVNFKQQQLLTEQKKLKIKNDLALLNCSCGIADTTEVILEKPLLSKANTLPLDQTLSFSQFIADSLILKNTYEQFSFISKPRLNIFGDAGYNSSLNYMAEKNFGASIGLHLVIPVYDGKQKNINREKIKLSENIRVSFLQFYKKQYSQNTLRMQQQLSSISLLKENSREQLALAEVLVKANEKLLMTGDAKIAEYIVAITNYITAQGFIIQLENDELQLISEYNYMNY